MKVYACLIALILVSVCLPEAHAQEYGKIRALDQRAAHIIKQRNDFVVQVLTSYTIPHERNEQGAVVRIKMDGQWLAVSTVSVIIRSVCSKATCPPVSNAADRIFRFRAGRYRRLPFHLKTCT